ncbi:hypothetical protein ACFFKU_12765 [Kineococcus gynurae]|uniref:Uncharacterized protein n=1 Tax=Kineococcus gynurae TaxID=452979 RepID=A0ABV5LQM2_9ACTN
MSTPVPVPLSPPAGTTPGAPFAATVRSRRPTRKWWVTQITALAALATLVVTTGAWGTEASVATIGLLSQALVSYLVPNAATPGGVPERVLTATGGR